MEKMVQNFWFRMILFLISVFISYLVISWYFSLSELGIVNDDGERKKSALLFLISMPIFFSVHTFFSLKQKELLFTRPVCFFLILYFVNFNISFIVGNLNFTENLMIISLISEIILYSISDDIKLINRKIDKENKKWEFTPIA